MTTRLSCSVAMTLGLKMQRIATSLTKMHRHFVKKRYSCNRKFFMTRPCFMLLILNYGYKVIMVSRFIIALTYVPCDFFH